MPQRILMLGTGPVAVQLAVLFHRYNQAEVTFVSRSHVSERSQQFVDALARDGFVKASVQNASHHSLEGSISNCKVFESYDVVEGTYDFLVLACTADAYIDTLKQLPEAVLKSVKGVLLVSPTLGSNLIVKAQLEAIQPHIEVVSCSTYLGDTRVTEHSQPNCVTTMGVKKHLYFGYSHPSSILKSLLERLFTQVGLPVTYVSTPIEAESRNSSLYVHPALFMNTHALKAIFYGTDVPFYVYKLFPEGPITMDLIHEMRCMWQEISNILKVLNVTPLNLLRFMVEENYPLRAETISKQHIEQFESLSEIEQEYLLYVRYTGILIDPFSQPDDKGFYEDFSAVPFRKIYQNQKGVWEIPRMPHEDYYRTKIIQGLGQALNVETPMIDTLLTRYETTLQHFHKAHPNLKKSQQFFPKTFDEEMICIHQGLQGR
ncbi:opine metallophore biosynthesis dehydrogenase [Staphylococcus ratti]